MSWRPRETVTGAANLSTADALVPIGSSYGASVVQPCNDIAGIALISMPGTGPFIQGAANATPSPGSYTSATQTFPGNNTAGNVIVVDVALDASFPLLDINISDTKGNTYVQLEFGHVPGAAVFITSFIAFGIAGGANTVNLTFTGTGSPVVSYAVAVHEYQGPGVYDYQTWQSGVTYLPGAFVEGGGGIQKCITGGVSGGGTPLWSNTPGGTTNDNTVVWQCISQVAVGGFLVGPGTISAALTVNAGTQLHLMYTTPCVTATLSPGPSGGPLIPSAWLVIDEPGSGYTDQTLRMFKGQGNQNNWTQQLKQRGQATVHMEVAAGDSYAPTRGTQLFLFDQTVSGYTIVFSGLIESFEIQYFGNQGDRYILIKAVSMESVLDTVYVSRAITYTNKSCGFIFSDLFDQFESGSQLTLGTVQAGPTVGGEFTPQIGQSISDVFQQLAATAQFTWFVDPATLSLNFQNPSTNPAPFTLTSPTTGGQPLFDSLRWTLNGKDYRNRQGIRLSYDAFSHSMEFFTGAGQQSLTLMRPVNELVHAYLTLSTPNTATGSFSGVPSPGDTFTVGPARGTWTAFTVFSLGGVIVVDGFVQVVTNAGTSGASQPTFSTITGTTTTDGSVIWTCQGPSGFSTGTITYTWAASIDNTQPAQVLIAATAAACAQNAADAINSTASRAGNDVRGVTFSLPTPENSQCNAIYTSGTSLVLQQKAAGTGWVAAISTTGTAFAWSAPFTSGGSSPNGTLGPNQGATIEIQVYAQGTSTAAPAVTYTKGSSVVALATPLDVGANLNLEYTRIDGDVLEVERSDLVAAFAAITGGTGKAQAFTDQSGGLIATNAGAGLQLIQEALAGFDTPPTEFYFDMYIAGLLTGMTLPVALTYPPNAATLINSTSSPLANQWIVESIEAKLVPVPSTGPAPWLPVAGAGHYKYVFHCISQAVWASYLDFWQGLGGGGSGASSGGGALVATSGGALATQGQFGSPITTKGDLIAGNATGVAVRLPVGTDGQILTANSGATDGIQWQSAGTGSQGLGKYSTTFSSATSVTVTHNLGTKAVLVQVYDTSGNQVDPQSVTTTSTSVVTLTFGAAFSGSVVVIGLTTLIGEYSTSWVAQTSVSVNHALNSLTPLIQVFDASGNLVVAQNVAITDANHVTLTFGAAFTGSVVVVAISGPARQVNASWTSQTSVTVTHYLSSTAVIVQAFDASGNVVVPQSITVVDANNVTLTFALSFTGSCSIIG
jgi:hypothetical protein